MFEALKKHWPEYLMEAAELGIFMISASVFTILLYHPSSPAVRAVPFEFLRRILMGVAMGLTAVGLVYSPWGKQSGAHMNPAFTLTFFRLGKVAPADAVFYVLAHFVGGLLGMLLAASFAAHFLAHHSVNYVATLPGSGGPWVAFLAEVAISFLLVMVVLLVSNVAKIARFTGLIAGACVAAFIVFESPFSGMSMNPARTFGSAFLPRLWNTLWIYFTAPPLGMLLAAEVYVLLKCRVVCAKYHHQNDFRCIFCEYQAQQKEREDMQRNRAKTEALEGQQITAQDKRSAYPLPNTSPPALNLNRNLINTPRGPQRFSGQRGGTESRRFLKRFSGFVLASGVFFSSMANVNSQTQPIAFQSSENQITLLELYTSEGCSSCPPAEIWLGRLTQSPGLWKDFVPVAFHVDYWDYLGWRDPWASKDSSARQRAYAGQWGSDSVYSPGFVLNGKEWRSWSASKAASPITRDQAGVLTLRSMASNHWNVTFTPTKVLSQGYTVHGALLASNLRSDVKAGENRGRRLEHDFVVLTAAEAPLTNHNGMFVGGFDLIAKENSGRARLALAAWVTQPGRLDPLQATGGWLTTHGAVSP